MKYLLCLLCLLLLSPAADAKNGNTISGKVTDADHKALPAVNIVLLDSGKTLIKADLTNEEGSFLLEDIRPGEYTIKATMPGFESYTSTKISLTSSTTLPTVVLKEKVNALDEVSVRAQKPFIEVKADRLIVNVENGIVSAGSSAYEVLQRSPGVRIDQNDNISLKGKSGVMIWIDGKPTPLSGADLANVLKSMPANSIDKVELISNPGARYDAAGSAGIINIKTKKDQRMGMNGSVNVSYGQGVYPKYGAGINVNYRSRKVNVYANYNYAYRYWFNHLMLDRRFLDDTAQESIGKQSLRYKQDNYALFDFSNHIGMLGADYNLSKKTVIGTSVNISTNSFNPKADNHSTALDGNNVPLYNFVTTGRHENFYFNYSANAYLRHTPDSSGKELSMDVDYASFGNQSNQNFLTTYQDPAGNKYQDDYYLRSDLTGVTQIRSIKADYTHPMKNNARIEIGAKSSFVTADNEPIFFENNSTTPDTTRTNHFIYNENINAAYLNTNKDWEKWSVQIGLRLENTNAEGDQRTTKQKFDTSYVQLFPSIAFQYHYNPKNDIGITLSRRIERPNYQQLNPFKYFIDKTTYREGYPYLKPASFYSVELSHTYLQKFLTTFTVGVNKGIITEVIQPSDNDTGRVTVQTNKNLDKMLFIGLSGSYPFQIAKWWTNVTNFNAYYANYEGNIANTPLNNGSPTIEFNTNNSFILPREYSAELGMWYQARQIYGYMDVRPTWALNAGLQKNFLEKRATLKINIQDIFWTGYPRATSTYTGYQEDFVAERETRQVNIALTYRFGKRTVAPNRRHSSGAEEEKSRAGNNGA